MRDWIPVVVALCALAAGLANYRGTLKVSRSNEEGNQLKWLQEAKNDAAAAKKEADEAADEAAEVKRELAHVRRKAAEMEDLMEEVVRWVLRVVAWKDDPTMTMEELRVLIDHGPPSLRDRVRAQREGRGSEV